MSPTSLTGSVPIDSILVSPQLRQIIRSGWIQMIEKSIGDHRSLFIDVPIHLLLGKDPFTIHRSTARRLVCEQSTVVNIYNKLLTNQLENQQTFKIFQQFEERRYRAGLLDNKIAIQILNN